MHKRRTKQDILRDIRRLKANEDNYITKVVRADPYSLVAKLMLEKIPHSEVFEGMTFKQVRAYCKNPIMTALYNSRAEPIKAFGEDTEELEAFYATLYELFPGAMNVLEALNNRWDPTAMYHTWKTPDGTVAHVKVINTIEGTLEAEGLELPYIFKENSPSKVGTSLAPNFVHSMDGFIVRYVIEQGHAEGFQVVHVHDEIQCHPNNMKRVKELYMEAIRLVATSRALEEFCEEDFGIDLEDFLEGSKNASYALC